MPSVSTESVSAVNFKPELITRSNSGTSMTIWSLGVTTTLAFGFNFLMRQLT